MRVAVVAGPDPGHLFPAAALCLRLSAAGHAVRLYSGDRYAASLARDGVSLVRLPLLGAAPDDPDTDLGFRLHLRQARLAPAVADLLRADAPDLVVADVLTTVGGFAAELLGVPWVELVPHSLHLPSVALPPPNSGMAPGRGAVGRARDAVLRRLHARSVAVGRSQRAEARALLGLGGDDPGPAWRMVATMPALEYPRPDWPARTEIVGPLHWDPAEELLAPPTGTGPLVVVSPSTAASGRAGLLPTALAALRGMRLAATVLEPYAAMVPEGAVVGAGRQGALLERADVAVVGAGHGVVTKALGYGVPLVLVPGGGDQLDLARRVARLGAGVVVRRLDPARLAAAVRRVLGDPSYAAAARRVAGEAADCADVVTVCERALTGSAA